MSFDMLVTALMVLLVVGAFLIVADAAAELMGWHDREDRL